MDSTGRFPPPPPRGVPGVPSRCCWCRPPASAAISCSPRVWARTSPRPLAGRRPTGRGADRPGQCSDSSRFFEPTHRGMTQYHSGGLGQSTQWDSFSVRRGRNCFESVSSHFDRRARARSRSRRFAPNQEWIRTTRPGADGPSLFLQIHASSADPCYQGACDVPVLAKAMDVARVDSHRLDRRPDWCCGRRRARNRDAHDRATPSWSVRPPWFDGMTSTRWCLPWVASSVPRAPRFAARCNG